MKFKILENLAAAKAFYGPYVKEDMGGLAVRRCGNNVGDPGKPNAIFHLTTWSVPLRHESGTCYDITWGFQLPELIKDFYHGFSDEARIYFGMRFYRDSHRSHEIHFHTTLTPEAVECVIIADKQDLRRPHDIPKDIQHTAFHYCPGHVKDDEVISWDYFYFPLSYSFNHLAEDTSSLVAQTQALDEMPERRQMIRKFLENLFGEIPYVAMDPRATPGRSTIMTPPQKAKVKPLVSRHYEDDMRHVQMWVMDEFGRLLTPRVTDDKVSDFVNATMACSESWDVVRKEYLVVKYQRDRLSAHPKFTFHRRPDKITLEQYDRLMILEAMLKKECKKAAKKLGVTNTLPMSEPLTWTKQLDAERKAS